MWTDKRHGRRGARLVGSCLFVCIGLIGPARADVLRVPEEYGAIQEAIDRSSPGDTVLVSPGTYRGPGNRDIEFRGKDIVVMGRDGPEFTVIDCERLGRGFYVHEWETEAAQISGFTVTNGMATPQGGGIYCGGASPGIVDCWIIGNESGVGGGIRLSVSRSRLRNCIIAGNRATGTGGGVEISTLYEVYADHCVITGNYAESGGGIDVITTTPQWFRDCTITANRALWNGGGIRSSMGSSLERCVVRGNCAGNSGNDVYAATAGADLRCCVVEAAGLVGAQCEDCIFEDPLFCGPVPCGQEAGGDWTVDADSPCLPANNPCGVLIGARGMGCGGPAPTGACCLPDGSCEVLTAAECAGQGGRYMGDETTCEPDPCGATRTESRSWGQIKRRFRAGEP